MIVELNKNENGHLRGLHIVIINPEDGKILSAQCFDTYKSSEMFDAFTRKNIPDGFIVIAAVKDECFTKLSETGFLWFESLGSRFIRQLRYRSSFAFIGFAGWKKGCSFAKEKLSASIGD